VVDCDVARGLAEGSPTLGIGLAVNERAGRLLLVMPVRTHTICPYITESNGRLGARESVRIRMTRQRGLRLSSWTLPGTRSTRGDSTTCRWESSPRPRVDASAIFRHFANKQELLREILLEGIAPLDASKSDIFSTSLRRARRFCSWAWRPFSNRRLTPRTPSAGSDAFTSISAIAT
jgi:hypothetical protein